MTTQQARRTGRGSGQSRGWPVPAGLLVLSAIPLAAGTGPGTAASAASWPSPG